MPKQATKSGETSPRVAKVASTQLSKESTPKPAKTTAASALSQAPDKAKQPSENKKK